MKNITIDFQSVREKMSEENRFFSFNIKKTKMKIEAIYEIDGFNYFDITIEGMKMVGCDSSNISFLDVPVRQVKVRLFFGEDLYYFA